MRDRWLQSYQVRGRMRSEQPRHGQRVGCQTLFGPVRFQPICGLASRLASTFQVIRQLSPHLSRNQLFNLRSRTGHRGRYDLFFVTAFVCGASNEQSRHSGFRLTTVIRTAEPRSRKLYGGFCHGFASSGISDSNLEADMRVLEFRRGNPPRSPLPDRIIYISSDIDSTAD